MNVTKTTKIYVDNVGQQNARAFWQQFDNMKEKIDNLQSKIDKANEILNKLCVMKPWNDSEKEMRKIYRPIKNTSKQEVYKAICDLSDILKEDK